MLDLFYSVWIPMTSYKYRSSEKSIFQIGKLGYGKWRRSKNWFSVIGVFLSALQAIIIAWKCLWKETCSSPYIQCWSQNIQALWEESQLILLLPVEMEDWISLHFCWFGASLVAQMVKNLPAMQETRVQSLRQEDPLEKGMATHFRILAWRISLTETPSRLQSVGSQRVGHEWMTKS